MDVTIEKAVQMTRDDITDMVRGAIPETDVERKDLPHLEKVIQLISLVVIDLHRIANALEKNAG